ncbi:MAG TPA: helix-turn-helix transcriptional regulator [Blastocatellia bacterium]|nr:helix-turn-helix transcriptional regulator [Blastocatellia bacterium]
MRRILREKGLSLRDVQRLSGGAITQSYVSHIVQGTYSNLTVEKLKALALGIGVDEDELFRVARGLALEARPQRPPDREDLPEAALEVARRVASDASLMEVLQEASALSPQSLAVLLDIARELKLSQRHRRGKPPRKPGDLSG